jgi:hypothetical protein
MYWISPDEQHVAMLSYDTTCTSTPTAGPLTVATLQAGGTWTTQAVAPEVSATFSVSLRGAVAWTPDGTQLVYATAGSCSSGGGAVYIANADGTGARQVYADSEGVAMGGQSLLVQGVDWSNSTNPWNLQYVALPAGSPQLVAYLVTNNAQLLTINPAGTAYLFDTYYIDHSGIFLVQTSSPTDLSNKIDNGLDFWSFDSWSPDGTQLAFAQAPANSSYIGLNTMSSTGTGSRGWCTYGTGGWFRGWSPDSRYACATETQTSTDVGTLIIDNGAGGTNTLTVPFAGEGIMGGHFDATGDVVYVTAGSTYDSTTQTYYSHLLASPTGATGTFSDLTPSIPSIPTTDGFAVSPTGAYAAARMGTGTTTSSVAVFARAPGGGSHAISTAMSAVPFYEAQGAQRLLVLDTASATSGALQIWSTDGSSLVAALPGQTPQSAPTGWTAPYTWFGREIVFGLAGAGSAIDLAASTDDGVTTGVLGSDVATWQVATKPVPSRVFFTVSASSGGGLWATTLPQP